MMVKKKNRVCPVERAGGLDIRIRRWLQNPRKILGPYIEEGMTVLDVGCGPGFFTLDLAQMVGKTGRVVAADLQEGMLQKLRDKIHGTEMGQRIVMHKCEEGKIGLSEKVHFILLFYMIHEIPNKEAFFNELGMILKSGGKVYIAEPPFHVSRKAFEETMSIARIAGFDVVERPKLFLNKTAVLEKH
jgi:ubiquinone/menaquinone biosynthesis C-methylase UbiE